MSDDPQGRAPEMDEEGVDVERLHRQLARELPEPTEGREPPPLWYWALIALAIFFSGYYLGRHGGVFGPVAHVGFLPPIGQEARGIAPTVRPAVSGAQVFANRCASCHQANAKGVPGAFPPLDGSEWVKGDWHTPIRIELFGLAGPITVAGGAFNGQMPSWKDTLSDDEIAAVVSYVRSLPGNRSGPVTSEEVAELRREARTAPWTAAELKAEEVAP